MTKKKQHLNDPDQLDYTKIITILHEAISHHKNHNKYQGIIVQASGGLVSTMALGICSLASHEKDRKIALFMPSSETASDSYEFVDLAATQTGFSITTIPIKFILSTVKNSLKDHLPLISHPTLDQQILALRHLLTASLAEEYNLLHIHCMSKNDYLEEKFPNNFGLHRLLFPFGELYSSQIRQLGKTFHNLHPQLLPSCILSRPSLKELPTNQNPIDITDSNLSYIDKSSTVHASCANYGRNFPIIKVTQ